MSALVLPGVVAGLVPPALAAADPWRRSGWAGGIVVLAVGLFVLLWTVRDFQSAPKVEHRRSVGQHGELGLWLLAKGTLQGNSHETPKSALESGGRQTGPQRPRSAS